MKTILGITFREMTESDWDGFSGAEDDSVINTESPDRILIWSESTGVLSEITEDADGDMHPGRLEEGGGGMITVTSPLGHYVADLVDTDDGVAVTVHRAHPLDIRGAGAVGVPTMRRFIHRDTLDCPFHVALDRMHDVVRDLERGEFR